MKTPNTLPTQWHRRPKGHVGACPVCGFPPERSHCRAEHRAVAPEEKRSAKAKWFSRKRTSQGFEVKPVCDIPPAKHGPKVGTVKRPHVPTKRIADQMGRAIYLIVAGGKTQQEAAAAMNIPADHIHDWITRWRQLWDRMVDQTSAALVDAVRETAGTDGILQDPDGYLRRAATADKWAAAKGVELFPGPAGETTLSQFFEQWYMPQRLFDARESTRENYASVVKSCAS